MEFTKCPTPDIRWGLLQTKSEDAIKEWIAKNIETYTKNMSAQSLQELCNTIFDSVHHIGYSEGYEAAQCDAE